MLSRVSILFKIMIVAGNLNKTAAFRKKEEEEQQQQQQKTKTKHTHTHTQNKQTNKQTKNNQKPEHLNIKLYLDNLTKKSSGTFLPTKQVCLFVFIWNNFTVTNHN